MTLTTYVDASGNWVNGVTPLSAPNMNAIRNFLIATGAMWDSNASWDGNGVQTLLGAKINAPGTNFPSGASGSATLNQFFLGTFKLVTVTTNGWLKSSAGDSVVAIPTPFTTWVLGIAFGSGPFHLNKSGAAVAVNTFTFAAVGSAGTASTVVNGTAGANNNNIFDAGSVDAVGLYGSQSLTVTGAIFMIGI